jgi:hypothetical protein
MEYTCISLHIRYLDAKWTMLCSLVFFKNTGPINRQCHTMSIANVIQCHQNPLQTISYFVCINQVNDRKMIAFSYLHNMSVKVQSEASLNGITKNINLHDGSVSGKHRKLNKGSWDSGIPFPSKYYFLK